jgi:hypothetical protein
MRHAIVNYTSHRHDACAPGPSCRDNHKSVTGELAKTEDLRGEGPRYSPNPLFFQKAILLGLPSERGMMLALLAGRPNWIA